jgi:hypothetical protein
MESTRRPAVSAIAALLLESNPELVITHGIGQGWKGVYVIARNNTAANYLGEGGGHTFPVDGLETIQVRQEEGRRAATVFGLEPHYLNLHEPLLFMGRKPVTMDDEQWGACDVPGHGSVTSSPEGKGLKPIRRCSSGTNRTWSLPIFCRTRRSTGRRATWSTAPSNKPHPGVREWASFGCQWGASCNIFRASA